jgi:hypothetical protein
MNDEADTQIREKKPYINTAQQLTIIDRRGCDMMTMRLCCDMLNHCLNTGMSGKAQQPHSNSHQHWGGNTIHWMK